MRLLQWAALRRDREQVHRHVQLLSSGEAEQKSSLITKKVSS